MWEAVLILRLIAATVPVTAARGSRRTSLAMPAGFFHDSIRLAYAAYRLSARTPSVEGSHKNNDKTIP